MADKQPVLFPGFLESITPGTPQNAAMATGGAMPQKSLVGAPVTQHTNVMPAVDAGKEKVGAFLPGQFVDTTVKAPEIAAAKTAPAPTASAPAPAKGEEKKEAPKGEDGINWLAVVTDALSGGLQEAGGERATAGYTKKYIQQQLEKQAQDSENASKLADIRAKYFGSGGGATAGTIIPGYKTVPGVTIQKTSIDNAQKIDTGKKQFEALIGDWDRFIETHKNKPVAAWDMKDRAEYDNMKKFFAGAAREAILGPGIMTPQEFDRITQMLPQILNPLEGYDVQRQKLDTLKNQVKMSANAQMRSYGFEPEEGVSQQSKSETVTMEMNGKRKSVPKGDVAKWQAQGAKVVQ